MARTPLKDITGSEGSELAGKKVVLCVTGSVAAIESPKLARQLMRHGAEVRVVMTSAAQRLVGPQLLEWATGNPVITELTGRGEHIELAGEWEGRADLILVAPATANTISKAACGIDDSPVTTVLSCAIGSRIPIIFAPGMHEPMYRSEPVSENMRRLEALGVEFVPSRFEEGKAKMAAVEEIAARVIRRLARQDMKGLKVLVTAGPTAEPIDPVRIITNRSSGRTGLYIAEEAVKRGAEVTVVYGRGSIAPPKDAKVIDVETTEQMRREVVGQLESTRYDIVIAAAAPADYAAKRAHSTKIPTRDVKEFNLSMKATPKVIGEVKKISRKTLLVAFKAEHALPEGELLKKAKEVLREAEADLVVANLVGPEQGFGGEENEVYIIDKAGGVTHIPKTSKREIAAKVLDSAVEQVRKGR